jgi:hypothetical protein
MIPFSCTIFSDVVVEADRNRLSRSLPDDFSSRLSIYFQNVNRLSLVEHECVKIKCKDFPLYVSASYLAPDVGKRTYELYVEDIEASTDNSGLRDVVLILGDFNLPKVKCKVDEKSGSMMPLNVTSDLESDLIGGLFGYDLDQINERPNENGTFFWIWCL